MCRRFNSGPRHRVSFPANTRTACLRADPARCVNQCAWSSRYARQVEINLAADEGRQILFEVFGREHAAQDDYWDGNWLSSRVSVHAGAFRGAFDASLRAEEFVRLRDGVRACMTDLRGTFAFETMEEQLSVVANGDGLGHFTAECSARDAAGWGNLLTFTLSLDQTSPARSSGPIHRCGAERRTRAGP
jgi:hypothetical protein